MNKTEKAYFDYLSMQDYLWIKFEGVKLRLADNTFYSPDFAVMCADRTMEMHEVKGWMTDDAAVKIKVAADMYPFKFKLIYANPKKNGGGWKIIDI